MKNKKLIFEIFRASAILMVVLGHFVSSSQEMPLIIQISIGSIAGYGVPLFFIISGFLLSASFASLLKKSNKLSAIKLFYSKRLLRIYPAYFVSLVILSFFYHVKFNDFLLHFFNIHNLFDGYNHSINGVYWSLAVEFQWYIIAPLIILLQLKYHRFIFVFLLCLMFISIYGRFYYLNHYFENIISFEKLIRLAQNQLYVHLFNFYIGVLIYQFRAIKLKLPVSLFYLFMALILCGYLQRSLGENMLHYQETMVRLQILLMYFSILLLGLFFHALLGIKLTPEFYWKPVIAISTVSYSLYIYHLPLLNYIISYHLSWFYALISYLFLSLLVSTISYFFVERYFLSK